MHINSNMNVNTRIRIKISSDSSIHADMNKSVINNARLDSVLLPYIRFVYTLSNYILL